LLFEHWTVRPGVPQPYRCSMNFFSPYPRTRPAMSGPWASTDRKATPAGPW
jgi:hypothetical protein